MIDNIDGVKRVANNLKNKKQAVNTRRVQFSFALKSAIMRNLNDKIGDKAKFFDVTITAAGPYTKISLVSKEQVGNYIYYGTKAHYISSSEPMPIGNNRFARNVSHPGTADMRAKVDEAVRQALIESKMIMRAL